MTVERTSEDAPSRTPFRDVYRPDPTKKVRVPVSKRCVDVVASSLGLLCLSPLLLAVGVLIKLDSPGPVFFRQKRIGQGLRPFLIYKFRTMVSDAPLIGGAITVEGDSRITRIGGFLRQKKLDELPQLINVLRGEMSLVGPRPEVPYYVDLFRSDYEEILRVRPGITDLASLRYRDEASELGTAEDPDQEYLTRVLPEKIALAKEYVRRSSFLLDMSLILKTVRRAFL